MRNNKGFTLISAVVACFILAIGVLSLTNLFPTSSVINARANRLNEATILAESCVENFRAAGYDSLVGLIEDGITVGSDVFTHFTRGWTLTQVSNIVQINVECEWKPPGRALATQRLNLVTLVSKYE